MYRYGAEVEGASIDEAYIDVSAAAASAAHKHTITSPSKSNAIAIDIPANAHVIGPEPVAEEPAGARLLAGAQLASQLRALMLKELNYTGKFNKPSLMLKELNYTGKICVCAVFVCCVCCLLESFLEVNILLINYCHFEQNTT